MQSKASQLRARGRAARGKKRTASEAFESSSKKTPPQQGCKPYSERGGKHGGGRGGGRGGKRGGGGGGGFSSGGNIIINFGNNKGRRYKNY